MLETATTRAGMIRFIRDICGLHSQIRCKPKRWDQWEWSIYCSFDDSYDFLLIRDIDMISWIINKEELAKLFLTRAIECDGHLCIWPDNCHNKFRFSIGFTNSDQKLLEFVRKLMEKYYHKNSYIETKKTPARSRVKCVFCDINRDQLRFVEELPWKHPEKIWKLELAVELCGERITEEGVEQIKEVRQKIFQLRQKTIKLAETFAKRPKGKRMISIDELINLLGI